MRGLLVLLIMLPGLAMAADELGRLFTTPAERNTLDNLRKISKVHTMSEQEAEPGEEAETVMPSSISMQGYVKRSDGKKGTVWINQKPVQESSSIGEVEVGKLPREGNQVPLRLPAAGKSLNLKAGQVYVPETNSVSEISTHTNASLQNKDEDSIGANTAPPTNTQSPQRP